MRSLQVTIAFHYNRNYNNSRVEETQFELGCNTKSIYHTLLTNRHIIDYR